MTNIQKTAHDLDSILKYLKHSVDIEPQRDRIVIDASLKRFDLTVILYLTLLRDILEAKGYLVVFPRDIVQFAYKENLIGKVRTWLKMLCDRHQISLAYENDIADQIYRNIKQEYYPILQKTYDTLAKEYNF